MTSIPSSPSSPFPLAAGREGLPPALAQPGAGAVAGAPTAAPPREPSGLAPAQAGQAPNTGDFLLEALAPGPDMLGRLTPGQFSQRLAAALDELSQAAELGGPDSRVLNRAVRLLKEEASLQNLLALYRNALHQG
ncbi:hypothetical protein V8Z80_13030 [Orrella sp. JC864]|uniref:type III secretion apparatus assembly protein SctX n=1 Tax=Orrella sp. JC864 TaxID=3120298 RepID=UPI00300A112E